MVLPECYSRGLQDSGFHNLDVTHRAVHASRLRVLNLVDNIHAFNHLAKYGVLSVKLGRADHTGLGHDVGVGERERALGCLGFGLLDESVL